MILPSNSIQQTSKTTEYSSSKYIRKLTIANRAIVRLNLTSLFFSLRFKHDPSIIQFVQFQRCTFGAYQKSSLYNCIIYA